VLSVAVAAQAQPPAPAGPPPGDQPPPRRIGEIPDCSQLAFHLVESGHLRHTGNVQCDLPDGVRVTADEVDIFTGEGRTRVVARGGVVFTGPEGHVWAARMEYRTDTGTGVFDDAAGLLTLGPGVDHQAFGDHDPWVHFSGERLEKVGPRKYRITRGQWTTCEQPTPRWEMASRSLDLNLEESVVARHTVLRVKNVPLFYLPWMYYPIQSDDRATGFLMPSYGTSTFRGQALSNAFFWAIGRSHDATFMHDWFTRAGQGAGAEYRYVTSPQSSGTFRLYRFNRRETRSVADGVEAVLPGSRSYEVTGNAVHTLWPGATGRVRLDYFSDVQSQQLLHQNLYEASRRNRTIEAGLTASFRTLSTSVLYQRQELVNDVTDTIVYGTTPRATAALAPQRLFGTPVYGSLNAEYSFLPYQRMIAGAVMQDDSFGRLDVSPSARVPLSRLSFLSVNTSASYRSTYYTRRAGETAQTGDGSYLRQYVTSRTDVVGPVLSRIWDLDDDAFADRVKHVIEPTLTVDLTSSIKDFRRTPILSDISDFVVGGSTRVTFGVTNRLFMRGRAPSEGARGQTREFVTVGIQQTYYTNPEASRYDTAYASAVGRGTGDDLSPVGVNVRVSPRAGLDGNARLEYGVSGDGLQMFTAGATASHALGNLTVSYSRQRFDRSLPANSFLSASTQLRAFDDRLTGNYSVSLDVARRYVVNQGIGASYMAQCCGVQGEFQVYNFPTGSGLPVTRDRRINVAFVLAGLGTFSNFFGAFGGL
jgi:LPS-assembly protein